MTSNKIWVQISSSTELISARSPPARAASNDLGNLRLDAVDDKGGVLALAVAGLGRGDCKGMSKR